MALDSLSTSGAKNGRSNAYLGPITGYSSNELKETSVNGQYNVGFTPNTFSRQSNEAKGQGHSEGQGQDQSKQWSEVSVQVPMWVDFTQRTTFHGVRYIFDPAPHAIRRSVYGKNNSAGITKTVKPVRLMNCYTNYTKYLKVMTV